MLAGAGHVFAGPDHLAAVAPLALDQPNRHWRAGFTWGMGHSSGVWILALAAVLLRDVLPLDALSIWGERLVGVVLILIGLLTLFGGVATGHRLGFNAVADAVTECDSPVGGADVESVRPVHCRGLFGVGALHGVAGASHLLAMLSALALPSRGASVSFMICFGVGAILAMSVFSWMVGSVADLTHRRGRRAFQALILASGSAAIVVGVCWLN